MEGSEQTNRWTNLSHEMEDFMGKEVLKKLGWDNLLNLSVCMVNKAWRDFFLKDSLWKTFLQTNLPFADLTDTTNYRKKFLEVWASYQQIRCGHPLEKAEARICPCSLPLAFERNLGHIMYYTGYNNEYILKLDECQCHDMIWTNEYLQFPLICKACFTQLKNIQYRFGKRGKPETLWKPNVGTWIHKELNLVEEISVAKPLPNSPNVIAITKNEPKKLVLLNISNTNIEQVDLIECTGDSLQISNNGNYVAVYTEKGLQGFVYNLESRKITFNFEREDYFVTHCPFPVAFLTYEDKEYLIASRYWNKIVLYDLESGEMLKDGNISNDTPFFCRDFFWNPLHVSPDQKNVCSFGWFWGPVGVCYNFSIDKWMKNDYDTPGKEKELGEGDFWSYPLCWIDNNTIALWGDSSLDLGYTLPVIRSINITDPTHESTCSKPKLFAPLEEGVLVFDEYLISLNSNGIAVIDVNDSHVLYISDNRQVEQVLCYNKQTKQVMSIKKDESNVLVLSHIQFNDKKN